MSRSGDDRWRRLSVALLVVSVISLSAGVVVGVFAADAEIGSSGSLGGVEGSSQEDPNELTPASGLSAYEQQLAQRLASRARQASVNVSSGDAERARSLLEGSEYESLLSAYGNLSEEGRNESEVRAVLRSNRLLENYTTTAAAYWETHRNYTLLEDANSVFDIYQPGEWGPIRSPITNDSRARTLFADVLASNATLTEYRRTIARELVGLDARTNETGTELVSLYRNWSVLGDRNGTSARAIRDSLENITETTLDVREDVFAGTNLTVKVDSRRISIVDPLRVTGRLTVENGTGLADRRITLRAGEVDHSVTTNDDGTFTLEYRPVDLPPNVSTVHLRYSPNATAPYDQAERTLNVTVERTKPTITVDASGKPIQYGDPVPITGHVRADGVGLENVPLVASVDGAYLNRTNSTESGRFRFDASLPADVDSGEATVRVRVLGANTSMVSTNATMDLSVAASETQLSVSARGRNDRTARVSGALELQDGTPVEGEPITLQVDGEPVSTARTTTNGTFETTISLPAGTVSSGLFGGEERVSLDAAFDPTGGNLESSRGSTTLTVASGSSLPLMGGLALLVALVAGLAYVTYGREEGESELSDDEDRSEAIAPSDLQSAGDEDTWLLEHARDELANGTPEGAIRASYAATRGGLESALADGPGGTHWEFYGRCRDAGLEGDDLEALRELTRLYERATFADGEVADEDGADAIALAEDLVQPS